MAVTNNLFVVGFNWSNPAGFPAGFFVTIRIFLFTGDLIGVS